MKNTFGSFGTLHKLITGPIMREMRIDRVSQVPAVKDQELASGRTILNPDTESILIEYNAGEESSNSMRQARVYWNNVNNALVCEFCTNEESIRTAWCKHIQFIVQERKDAGFFETGRYVIPVIPSEGVYCPVHFEAIPGNEKLLKVYVTLQHLVTDADESNVIGIVSKEDTSIADIRVLLFDWLAGWMENKDFFSQSGCQSNGHDSSLVGVSEFSSNLYPAMYGMCLPCLTSVKEKQDSNASDVPDF